MNPKHTAIVLIEFQNDFTSEGGSLHEAVKGVMLSTGMLAKTGEVVRKAREAGIQIIHCPISFSEGYTELTSTPYGVLKDVVATNSFRKGSWGAEIVDVLAPEKGDIIIEGKRGLCGFASTNLDFILRSKGFTHIALAGFLTNCCVESTMRTAYELGYRVITLTDCTATLGEEEQRVAIEKDFPMFSHPMTHDQFIAEMAGGGVLESIETRGYA